jgi:hypothetical protein
VPGRPLPVFTTEPEPVDNSSLTRKVESGIAEPNRDTSRNRYLAKANGWSDSEYGHWVDTGEPPIRSVVKETPATRSDEIDDDERLHQ